MPGLTRAVIDIGTNSVKLLVATVEPNCIIPLFEGSEQTRLGEDFYQSHILKKGAIDRTAQVVAEYVDFARRWQLDSIRIIATSAARDALNREELIRAIEAAAAVPLEVIDGEQEADWAFQGVTSDPSFQGKDLLVLDMGGGSSEFILGKNKERFFARSFSIGTVRILERCKPKDPPSIKDLECCEQAVREILSHQAAAVLKPELAKTTSNARQLVATGGTATILARMQLELRSYDREKMEGLVLTQAQLAAHKRRLWALPLEERKKIIGLPSRHADVILAGIIIFDLVMRIFDFPTLMVSTRGLRFGAVAHG